MDGNTMGLATAPAVSVYIISNMYVRLFAFVTVFEDVDGTELYVGDGRAPVVNLRELDSRVVISLYSTANRCGPSGFIGVSDPEVPTLFFSLIEHQPANDNRKCSLTEHVCTHAPRVPIDPP
jgi:hypothetical protein